MAGKSRPRPASLRFPTTIGACSGSARRNLDKAIADYTKAIEIDPNYGLAFYNRANALGEKGDLDRAIADYGEAIWIDGNILCVGMVAVGLAAQGEFRAPPLRNSFAHALAFAPPSPSPTPSPSPSPMPLGPQPVVWTALEGVSASGNSLTKTSASGVNSGAISVQQLPSGDGYVEVTASETSSYRMFGFSKGNTDSSYQDIDFGLDLAPGMIYVFEKGVNKGNFGSYATGDRLRVAVVGGVVRYSRNGAVFYTSTEAPTYPLLVDTWLYHLGATLNNAVIAATVAAPPPPPPPSGAPVVWTALEGVSASGSSLTKTSASGVNSGAISVEQIPSGDGYVELTASETSTYRMFGLSNVTPTPPTRTSTSAWTSRPAARSTSSRRA